MFGRLKGWVSNDIAIDLGTANTLIYIEGRGIVLNEPSVVAVDRVTRKVLAFGAEAKAMLGRTPTGIDAVRPLKDGVIADFEMTEELLRKMILKVQARRSFVKPRVIVCVPSGITEVEKRAVRDSVEHAGARDVFLVAEPIAAAVGVGLPVETPTANMVIDIGGGTTEIAVMTLNGIVNHTSIRIGGDKMDNEIVDWIKKNKNLLIGDQTAEMIKIDIGSACPPDGNDPKEEPLRIRGRDLVGGIPKHEEITWDDVRQALRNPVNEILEALKRSLEEAPPELASDIVDRGITMTGGGALLRRLNVYLSRKTGLAVRVADGPLSAVVLGAGRILDNLSRYDKVIMRST